MQIDEETFFFLGVVNPLFPYMHTFLIVCAMRIYSDDDDDHDDANLSVCASTLYYIYTAYREREKTGRVRTQIHITIKITQNL